MEASSDSLIEAVILEGGKCLGVPYVYGATRYLDENGKRISSFNSMQFDCSSLMQYIFKLGAGVNLKLNTRTQIYQGTTVKKSEIQRGDLLFFTNDARKNNVGIERVGHVALYLGDNYILHTSSDYARIEQISTKRWSYYIQAQRIL
ncbi:MAG: C40 family peptidase [Candidatus Coproplasma sp.]